MQGARIRQTFVVLTLLAGLTLVAAPGYGQTGQAKGKVVDAKNQPVEGATVTIEATDGMGRKYTVKSNRRGEFVQIGLQPGQYRFTAEKDGLSDSHNMRVGLDVVEVNFSLRPGGSGGDASAEEKKKAEARVAAIQAAFAAGNTLSKEGKYDEAIAKFNEVLKEAPKCAECYVAIGLAASGKKDHDAAEAAYKQAIALNPNSADAYNQLASLYNLQKKFDQAAEMSAQAQKLGAAAPGGQSASAVYNQGVILWNSQKYGEAKKAFEEAIKLDPKMADAHYLLGMANLNQGNMPEAIKALEEYLKVAPTGQYAEQVKAMLSQLKK
jgi:TolA-binding protein